MHNIKEWPEMTSGENLPFLEIGRKYNSGQNYAHNFSFPKMDDDLEILSQSPSVKNDLVLFVRFFNLMKYLKIEKPKMTCYSINVILFEPNSNTFCNK